MTDATTAADAIDALVRRNSNVQERGLLTAEQRALDALGTQIAGLGPTLADLRRRGYHFRKELEGRVEALAAQWPAVQEASRAEATRQIAALRPDLQQAENAVRMLSLQRSHPLARVQASLTRAEGAVDRADDRVTAAARAVSGMVDGPRQEAAAIARELQEVGRILDARDASCVEWHADEAIVDVVQASWLVDGAKDPVPGFLYLTDARVAFERCQKVAKKKVLFITTESELVRDLQWEAPLNAVAGVLDTEQRKALVFKKELLSLRLSPPSRVQEATLQLAEDSTAWRLLIRRAMNNELDAERVGAPEGAAAPVVRYTVPNKCPACGAAVAAAGVVRAAVKIECEYCGSPIPLTPLTAGQ